MAEADATSGPCKRRRIAAGEEDPLASLRTPCYVVDVAVARANAERMLAKAASLGVALRPHVKTHKTLEGATIQTGGTKRRIVVSSLAEATFFADGGFDDILYAVPITPDKLPQAAELTARLEAFLVLVDHEAQLDALLARPQPAGGKPWRIVLMVDCGYGRDGVDPDDESSVALVKRINDAPNASFVGIYTHGGHSYDASSVEAVVKIGEEERDAVVKFASKLKAAGVDCSMVGVGSTPTSSNPPAHLRGVTEMHPGNYVYYDWMQAKAGNCRPEDVAVRVCTRIIGHYPKTNMLLIDMGWTGISKQGAEYNFGFIDGHPELKIVQLKQECGAIESADGSPLNFSEYPIGSILRVLPYHSCAATHQHACAHVLEGGKIVGEWKNVRGW